MVSNATVRMPVVLGLIGAALALAGCTFPGLGRQADPQAAAAPEGESWIVVTKGDPPAEEPAPAPPVEQEEPVEEQLPDEPQAVHPEVVHEPCVGTVAQGQVQGLTVVAQPGAAAVTWYHPGDPAVVSYRLAAVPQRLVSGAQPDLAWQTVPAPEGCRDVTLTVRGLHRDAPYVFWLDAVRNGPIGDGTRSATVARSDVITTR